MTLVDDQDYDFLMQWKWFAKQDKSGVWYAARGLRTGKSVKHVYMHRIISNAPDGMETDHVDHDGLHNWRGNLRVCTRAQNQQNTRCRSDNSSGYKGVHRHKGMWEAKIRPQHQWYCLGTFATPEDAARAYNVAAIRHFGEFAVLNQV